MLGPVFMHEYETFWQTSETPPDSKMWLAILNLIFALGAVQGHLMQANLVESDQDHMLYFLRARLLNLEPLNMIHVPAVENVQLALLFGLYLLASCQVNR